MRPPPPPPPGEPKPPKKGGGKQPPDKNKILAEMRILRDPPGPRERRTVEADQQRPKVEAVLGPDLRDKITGVRDHQAKVRDAMEKLSRAARDRMKVSRTEEH